MKKRLRLWVKIVIFLILLITTLVLYGLFINLKGFKVNEIPIYSKFEDKYDGFKIVQISDIYYGNTVNKKDLKKIIDRINLIKPDIVVFTGDLLYKDTSRKDELIDLLKKIEVNIDKYYITGDNDYNNNEVNEIFDSSDFINLNDTYNLIYKDKIPILIAGISTSKNKTDIDEKLKSTIEYIDKNNIYSMLIMHEPNVIEKFDYTNFNLILAGHNLGGVIKIPYIGGLILKENNYLYGKDYYNKKGTKIYISNGLGNDNINFRLFNKPSFNFYRLRKK